MVEDGIEGASRGYLPRVPRAEVRRRLLIAARQAFAEHGYTDSRLDDIAHAAGFSKGAVYSNFGSKQELFAAVLSEESDEEAVALRSEIGGAGEVVPTAEQVARLLARRITTDTERGRLGLDFAANAARDEQARAVLGSIRRTQRRTAADLVRRFAESVGVTTTADPGVVALILHCLTNGLSMEHLADPEAVGAEDIQQALSTVITALTTRQPGA